MSLKIDKKFKSITSHFVRFFKVKKKIENLSLWAQSQSQRYCIQKWSIASKTIYAWSWRQN